MPVRFAHAQFSDAFVNGSHSQGHTRGKLSGFFDHVHGESSNFSHSRFQRAQCLHSCFNGEVRKERAILEPQSLIRPSPSEMSGFNFRLCISKHRQMFLARASCALPPQCFSVCWGALKMNHSRANTFGGLTVFDWCCQRRSLTRPNRWKFSIFRSYV